MVSVEVFKGKSVIGHRVEVVERKGTGHPDYICDAVMESISIALVREYKKTFGTILHHNIDKGLLAAGKTETRFGGGRVVVPMELTIGDRAASTFQGKCVPVIEIATRAAKEWIGSNLRFVNPKQHVRYRVVLSQGSEELMDIFARDGRVRRANDTSALVGYYPLSPTEESVFKLERYLNSARFKARYPETGEDVKVMGLRTGNKLDLTVAMPLVADFIKSEREYFKRKRELLKDIEKYAREFDAFKKVNVNLNSLDEAGRGLGGVYLSLLGTSAEDADSGQVGRGNRVNGLIAPGRPMSTEAAAGKNCVSHVGKIYNVLAHRLAEKIYRNIDGVQEAYVLLLSRIGAPIDEPVMASAQLLLERGRKLDDIKKETERIIKREFRNIAAFCERLGEGKYPVC